MTAEHLDVLRDVATAFPDRQVVVIGAAALRWHDQTFRGTLDLDLCIAIDREEHDQQGVMPVGWQRHSAIAHRWRDRAGQLIDVIPAADSVLASGQVAWPDGTTMDLTGIDLVMQDNHRYADELPENVRVASRRALFVTKIAAWLDRPHDRQKDLGDIAILLNGYVGLDDPRRFDEPALEGREWQDRPAFLLGMDLAACCEPRHRERIRMFVDQVTDRTRREHHWLLAASPGWRADPEILASRIGALVAGLA